MSRTTYAFFIILFLLSLDSFGQGGGNAPQYSVKNKKAIRFYQESENFFVRRQFGQAIHLLEQAIDKAPDFTEAHIRLGTIYRSLGEYDKALTYLEEAKVVNKNPSQDAQALFSLGELYWQLGRYSEAEEHMKLFVAQNPKQKQLLSIASNIVEDAAFAKEQLNNPLPFTPEPLSQAINSNELQYFPVLTVDQQNLIFTRRITSVPGQDEENLMISRKDSNGNWTAAESLSPNINTKENEGTCTISADGRTLIFTSCQGRKGYGSCDLFISRKKGEEWSKPENLGPAINSKNWESQPSLSADGRAIYFVSNRPGGNGGNDIWVSVLNENGEWGKPANLGSKVNTPFDEVSPFIHANGQSLYFSSNGHKGMGGYDLFITEKKEEEWQTPRNLGYPINTHEDQVSLFVTADGKKGYYAFEERRSSRLDRSFIYQFDIPEQAQVRNRSNYVTGKVYDAVSRQPIEADISCYDIVDELIINSVTSDPVNGTYYIVLTEGSEYALYVSKKGYIFKSLAFNYGKNNTLEPVKIDVYLEPIRPGVATTLNNIFFDTDRHEIQPKSETELNRVIGFLKENPSVKIEIGGHTDDVGNATYNLQLSDKRAKAVYDYLISKGISPARLRAKGYGQTKPLAENTSEKSRQLNRRIEFLIQ